MIRSNSRTTGAYLGALFCTVALLVGCGSEEPRRTVPLTVTLADERPKPRSFPNSYPTRHDGAVFFNHMAHMAAPNGCASCHHEGRAHDMEHVPDCDSCHADADDGSLLSNVNVRCIECHSTPGFSRFLGTENIARRDSGMSTELHFSANAFHGLCIECHEQFNIAQTSSWAPVACISCHTSTPTNYEFIKD